MKLSGQHINEAWLYIVTKMVLLTKIGENKEVNIQEEQSITDKDTTPSVPLVGRSDEQNPNLSGYKKPSWQQPLQMLKEKIYGANENAAPPHSEAKTEKEETADKELADNPAENKNEDVSEDIKEIIADTTNDNSEKDGTDKG